MPKRTNREPIAALAIALAAGQAVTAWAKAHDVPRRTAYRWSRLPEVQQAVAAIRRRAVDRAAGELSKNALKAARKIVHLADKAASEAVALAAARAVLSDLRQTADWIAFEQRLGDLERTVHRDRDG